MNNRKILIIEDELLISKYITQLLKRFNCEVVGISQTGEDGIEKAIKLKPDLIIVDIQLQGDMSGIDFSKEIGKIYDVPIIYLTGNSDPMTLQEADETNHYGIIIKPIDEKKLETFINSAMYQYDTKKQFKWNELNYKTILDNMKNGVAVYKAINDGNDFIFVSINKASENIDNIKASDIIGKSVLEVFPDIKTFGLLDVFIRVYKTGEPEHYPMSLYKDERISGWRENYVYKLPTGEIVAIYSDVTKQKQAEEKFKNQYQIFKNIAELSPTAITMVDNNGKLTFANKKAQELLGIKQDKINTLEYNSPDWNITDFDGNPYPDEKLPFSIIMNTKEKVFNIKHAISRENNDMLYLSINGAPLFNNDGKIKSIIFNIEDISAQEIARKKILKNEEKLEEANIKLQRTNEELEELNEELEATNEELRSSLEESDEINNRYIDSQLNLKERIKELNCFYKMSQIIDEFKHSKLDILKRIVMILPPAFQHPEITSAKITLRDQSYYSNNFNSSDIKLYNNIYINEDVVGDVSVYYKDLNHNVSFIKEEERLLSSIAERLGKVLERIEIENNFRIMIKEMPVMIDAFSENMKIQIWNTKCEEITGFSKNDMKNSDNPMKLLYPDEKYLKQVQKDWTEKRKRGINEIESTITTKNGNQRIIKWYNNSDFVPLEGLKEWAIGIDITDWKKAEEELKMNENRLKSFYKLSNIDKYNEDDIKKITTEEATKITNSYYGFLFSIDKNEHVKKIHHYINNKDENEKDNQIIESIYESANNIVNFLLKNNRTYIINKYNFSNFIFIKKMLFLPVYHNDEIISMILLINKEKDYTQFDINQTQFIIDSLYMIIDKKNISNSLEKSIKDKEVLIKEIHHRVKNNLQIIVSLLKMQQNQIKDDNFKNIFLESINRVNSMSLIHKQLYQSRDLSDININNFLQSLLKDLLVSYSIDMKTIDIDLQIDNIHLNINKAIPFAQIANELISNTIKHVILKEKQNYMKVHLRKINNKYNYKFIISDNGKGLPDDINIYDPDTLGLQIVSILVSQLDGDMKLNKDNGTEFSISF